MLLRAGLWLLCAAAAAAAVGGLRVGPTWRCGGAAGCWLRRGGDLVAGPLAAPPRRLLLVVEPTPFNYISGYANRFKEMLKHLRDAGDTVEVVTSDPDPSAPTQFLGYKVHNLHGVPFPWYPDISISFDLCGKLRKVMSDFRPDLVHVTSPSALLLPATYWARRMNLPLVMSYHTDLVQYTHSYVPYLGMRRVAQALVRRMHSSADLTLCTSPQLRQQLEDLGVQRVAVWRKGINTEVFSPRFRSVEMRNRLSGGAVTDPLLLFVGRLGVEKRVHRLRQVLVDNPGARLAIVGTGPAEVMLRQAFRGLPVVFAGSMTGDALSQAFASADLFLMPSDTETLGFVVLEAMASGLPVVGARAGGVVDCIDHGHTGFLAASSDSDMSEFSRYVRVLLQDTVARQRMGEAAQLCTQALSWREATRFLRDEQYPLALLLHGARDMRGRHAADLANGLMARYHQHRD